MPTSPFSFTGQRVPQGATVVGFRGREAISKPYEYEVFLAVPEGAMTADGLRSLLHARATLKMLRDDGAARRVVHGVMLGAGFVRTLPGGASLIRVTLGPALARLALGARNRVWVDRDVVDVVKEVLRAGGLGESDVVVRLREDYEAVEHLCQYRESHLDFVSRRLEAEGIYYHFEHPEEGDSELLVLSDNGAFMQPLSGEGVRFVPVGDDDVSGVEGLRTFELECTAVPLGARSRGADYLRPGLDVSGAHGSSADATLVTHHLEPVSDPTAAARRARVRQEAHAARAAVAHGEGVSYELRAGYSFDLEDHPLLAGVYLATSVTLEGFDVAGHRALAARLGFRGDTFHVAVEAIEADVQYRPERATPSPVVSGTEPGVVAGAARSSDPGRYAHLDEHGRYRVRLRFDDDDGKASPSVPMRMAQPHAGEGAAGIHFPLRDGTEVLVGFVRGDPDLPYIAAAVPDALTPPPVTRDNASKNILRTGGGNRIEMEDREGAEYIKLSTPYKNATFHLGAPHNPRYDFELVTSGRGLIRTGKDGAATQMLTQSTEDTKGLDVNEKGLGIQVGGNVVVDVDGSWTETIRNTDRTDHKGNNSEEYFFGHRSEVFAGAQEELYFGSKLEIAAGVRVELALVAALSVHGGLSLETFLGASADICFGPRYERSRLTIQDEEAMRIVNSRLDNHTSVLRLMNARLNVHSDMLTVHL